MNFIYQKSAKRRGIEGMLICTLFTLLCLGAGLYLVFIKQEPRFLSFINNIVVWLLGFLLLVLYGSSFRLYLNSGGWDIQITETEVIWKSPPVLWEKNFQVSIHKISKIICEFSSFSDSSNSYYLLLDNGKEVGLESSLSGLNINKFIQVLKQRGIEYERRES